jgi:glutamine synthetase
MLAAGLDGIEKSYKLREPIERNLYEMSEEERIKEGIETLPESLYEAITLTEKSELIRKTLGDHIFYKLIENKKIEWKKHRIHVTALEIEDYLPIL